MNPRMPSLPSAPGIRTCFSSAVFVSHHALDIGQHGLNCVRLVRTQEARCESGVHTSPVAQSISAHCGESALQPRLHLENILRPISMTTAVLNGVMSPATREVVKVSGLISKADQVLIDLHVSR